MATVTRQIGGDGDPARGYVFWEIDFDDAKLLLTAVRCRNESSEATYGSVTQISNGRTYGMRFPPNSTTNIAIPTGQAQKIDISIMPSGKLDGVHYSFVWPYP